MLTAKFRDNYRKKVTGTPVFRYVVSGTDAELKEYETTQGNNFRQDDKTGEILWFSTRFVGDNVTLRINDNDTVSADDSELLKIQSMIEQYGADTVALYLKAKG